VPGLSNVLAVGNNAGGLALTNVATFTAGIGGNVGIGTASPGTYKLNVAGTTYFGSNSAINGDLTLSVGVGGSRTIYLTNDTHASLTIHSSDGDGGVNGGALLLRGGDSDTGNGADVTIRGGDSTENAGGSVLIRGGYGAGSDNVGILKFPGTSESGVGGDITLIAPDGADAQGGSIYMGVGDGTVIGNVIMGMGYDSYGSNWLSRGNVGIGTNIPTAKLHIIGSLDGSAGTASLKLEPGTLLTSPESGAMEYNGTNLYFTTAVGGRKKILQDGAVVSNAVYATNSGFAVSSGYATNAATATFAATSGYATNAGSADTATFAASSGYATNAGSATSAGTATFATTSGYATNTGAATSAGTATFAVSSSYATNAGTATFGASVFTAGVTTVTSLQVGSANYPTNTILNRLLYSTATNTIGELSTTANRVLTSSNGVPSWALDLFTSITIGSKYIYRLGGTDVSVPDGGTGKSGFSIPYGIICAGTTTNGALQQVPSIGLPGQVLVSGGSNTIPSFQDIGTDLYKTITMPGPGGPANWNNVAADFKSENPVLDNTSSTNFCCAGYTDTFSWSHTVNPGTNKLLVVNVLTAWYDQNVVSVTYNGKALTYIISVADREFADNSLWYLLNPDEGTYDIVVTMGDIISTAGGVAASYSGIDQQAPDRSVLSTAANSDPGSLTLSNVATKSLMLFSFSTDGGTMSGPSDGTIELQADNGAGGYVALVDYIKGPRNTVNTKTDNYTVRYSDSGKTLVMDSASDKTFTLPSVSANNVGLTFTFVKINSGRVTIQAADSDTIDNSTGGGTIYDSQAGETYATITIQLVTETKWVVIGIRGTWSTS
jgi:hypothetical protein